jgi:hypothetical protein
MLNVIKGVKMGTNEVSYFSVELKPRYRVRWNSISTKIRGEKGFLLNIGVNKADVIKVQEQGFPALIIEFG